MSNASSQAAKAERMLCAAWFILLGTMALGSAALQLFASVNAYPTSSLALWSWIASKEGGQDYVAALATASHTVVPTLVMISVGLGGYAAQKLEPDPAAAASRLAGGSRYTLLALALWVLSELWLSNGYAGVELDYYVEQPLAPVIELASARLDHPWPLLGAAIAALLLFLGARSASHPLARTSLHPLAAYALLRTIADLVSYVDARELVRGREALPRIEGWEVLAAGLASLSILLVAAGFAWSVRTALRVEAPGRRSAQLAILSSAYAIAALCSLDATGFVAAVRSSAAQRLAHVLEHTHTNALTTARPGGGVHENFAVLHEDGTLTLVVRDQLWRLSRDQALPTPGEKLLLIADARCTIAELHRRVQAVPEGYTLLFGRTAVRPSRPLSPLGPTRAARIAVASAPFIARDASLLLWPDARPQDLATFPPTATVGTLAEGEPLRTARAPGHAKSFQLPAPERAPNVSASLFALGW